VQSESIDGYFAIYISPQNWISASADGDLGPFAAAQEASPSHSMACLFTPIKNNAVCVYFEGERAYGLTALRSDPNHPFTSAAAAASYKPITRELLKKAPGKIAFSPVNIKLDNGQSVDGFLIKLGQ
jgi:hypothetical protein